MSEAADYIEQDRLTEKQLLFIDRYMTNGFDKVEAFYAAGYTGPKSRAPMRIAKLFADPLVQAEVARRRAENSMELKQYSPLEVMSKNLDYWFGRALDKTLSEGDQRQARSMAQDVAREAAPYVHPRLQAIAVRASLVERDIDDYTDDELDLAIARLEQKLQARSAQIADEASEGRTKH